MSRRKPALHERYLLGRMIGRGGVCVVHEAIDRRTGRRYAVKHLHDQHAHRSDLRMRLVREAEVLDLVKHPNVVSVVELVDDADGTFIVLEYLDGLSLERIIAVRGKLSLRESITLLRQACHAVATAHSAGIVHRDLKPSNLVVLGTGDLERSPLKVIDFGTATAPMSSSRGGPKLTGDNVVLGTPEYIPLEQLTGDPPTKRGDVYALGVTLYECLTGRVPFEGELREVIHQWALSSMLRVEDLRPDVPAPMAELVARAIARDPTVRFEDADAMLVALDEVAPLLRDEPASGVQLRAPDRIPAGIYRG